MPSDLQHILKSVGLSEREAALYLAGLHLAAAPASQYAKASKLNRVTAYNCLEELVHRGHFTCIKKQNAKWYAPVEPESLSLDARKNADALARALPELRSIRGSEHRSPRVKFFEGWEGVKRVYEDTFTAKTELLNFANSAVVRRFWPNYDEEYVAERVRRKIHLRGIAPDDSSGRKVHGDDRAHRREIRLVPASEFDFTNEVNIYDSKVAICSFGNPSTSLRAGPEDMFGVIIESTEVAETQRQIFEMAWRYAGRKT